MALGLVVVVTLESTILMRKRTSVREKRSIWLQFDRYKLRLLICEFLEKKLDGGFPRANSSRLGSSKGRVEDESSSKMSKDIDWISRVRKYRLDADQEDTNAIINENYDLYYSLN